MKAVLCLVCAVVCLFQCSLCDARLLFGFKTKEFAYLSSDSNLSPNGFRIVDSYEWLRPISTKVVAGLLGDSSDCETVFSALTAFDREHNLRSLESSNPMSVDAVANICRSIIAYGLIRGKRMDVNGLVAGWSDSRQSPVLYWLDSIGSLKEVPYAAHGNEFPLVLSLFDEQRSRSGTSRQESTLNLDDTKAINLVRSTWDIVKKRKIDSVGDCRILVVGRDGCKNLGILR